MPHAPPAPHPRTLQPLHTGFRFAFGERAGAERPEFDDSDWQLVEVPHTWNEEDGVDGDNAYRRGPGYYRLMFRPASPHPAARPAERATDGKGSTGRRHYLRFEGVSMVATVWLNGRELGTHWGAHSAFCFDVSDVLQTDADNLLVVRADNSFRDDVPPREGDFTIFGGIHRGVALVAASSLSFDLLDHAGSGVYLTTPVANAERAVVRAHLRLQNATERHRNVSLSLTLAGEGGTSGTARADHLAAPGITEAALELSVKRPRLWHGRLDPYLYQAIVDVCGQDGLEDRVIVPLGLRTFRFDSKAGFFLNDQPYPLYGVNLHEDREGRGWAVDRASREEDFRLIAELGCTFVRLVHYQHDQYAYELCDRLGLVAWAEHGLVNSVSSRPLFADRCARQLLELIRQSFHHPSIVTWGIGNEVKGREPGAAELLGRLSKLVASADPTRPSTLATCYDETPGAYGTDLIAHNKYFGWYTGTFADLVTWLDGQKGKAPFLCQGMSEYGAGAGPSLHAEHPAPLDHTEEHQCALHESYWRALRERSWLWCKVVWQMFDTASDGRNEGERPGINDKGLVTRDRKTKKDAFYWYKASWSRDPFVYITSRRFALRTHPKATVKVYSNCEQVALSVNGRSLGAWPVDDHIASFAVTLVRGENHIEVRGTLGKVEVADECIWTLPPE